jgi:gluconolactonase
VPVTPAAHGIPDDWEQTMTDPTSIIPLDSFTVFADGLDHPECVAAGPDGELYAGGEAGQIYRMDGAGPREIANTGGFILGMCLDGDGNVYACDLRRQEVLRITPAGDISRWGDKMRVPNYPVFTDDGHLFVSDSGARNARNGCLYRISPDGAMEEVPASLRAFPNGLAISPDGEWLYVILSTLPGVVRVHLDGSDVRGDVEPVVELPDHHFPDGLAFDSGGALLISCYVPDAVYRWDGTELVTLAHDPWSFTIATPTNIAFHGPNRDQLAIASLGRWHIASTDRAGTGAPLRYPKLGA